MVRLIYRVDRCGSYPLMPRYSDGFNRDRDRYTKHGDAGYGVEGVGFGRVFGELSRGAKGEDIPTAVWGAVFWQAAGSGRREKGWVYGVRGTVWGRGRWGGDWEGEGEV